ncbi:MAG: hypothetical protein QOG91_416 [Candidatus Parcubacteria bacterium]|jgi:hypothetical protein|nr:hypothetical protein [Candidatus Parcubacteria bacterium]
MATITPNTAAGALKKRFDKYVAILQAADLATEDELAPLYPLLKRIGKIREGRGWIPFIIIAQNPRLTPTELMAKVIFHGKHGVNHLNERKLTITGSVPHGNYLMVNVEDGRAMMGYKPCIASEHFRHDKRSGGYVGEGILTVICEPHILSHHYMDFPGSRYGGDEIPCLDVRRGRPDLSSSHLENAHIRFGPLSCGQRLGLHA